MLAATAVFAMMSAYLPTAYCEDDSRYYGGRHNDYYDGHGFYGNRGQRMQDDAIQLGPRPFYLVQGMDEGKLKDRLMKCENGPFYRSVFSIGHRGAALQLGGLSRQHRSDSHAGDSTSYTR
jgi:glycerophosphoryl diester phosphodiesterase